MLAAACSFVQDGQPLSTTYEQHKHFGHPGPMPGAYCICVCALPGDIEHALGHECEG